MSEFCGNRGRLVVACLVMLGSFYATSPSKVHAVPLPGFTGYTGDKYVTINYAVLSPFDAFAGVLAAAYVPAMGNSAFDASKYTYLYQVASPVSTGLQVSWDSLEANSRQSHPVSATTVGAFASGNFRLDFLNGGTIVNTTGNNLQGPGSFGIAARTVSGAEQIQVVPNFCCGRGLPNWGFGKLSPGFTSPLVGYQSNFAPAFDIGAVNGFSFAPITERNFFYELPNAYATSAPEPSTVLLIGSGLLGMIAWRRTKQTRPL